MKEQQNELSRPTPKKKPYQTPTLASYGSVEKLTQGAGGTKGDGSLGMTRI
jgi:hypothetical protein